MTRERFRERQNDVRSASARLREALAEPPSALVCDATIQRFEFTFEAIWKTLRLYLERQGHAVATPRETFKKAFTAGLIASEEEADAWLRMLEDRNLTAHTYREELARQIHERIGRDYASRIAAMADRIARLSWD